MFRGSSGMVWDGGENQLGKGGSAIALLSSHGQQVEALRNISKARNGHFIQNNCRSWCSATLSLLSVLFLGGAGASGQCHMEAVAPATQDPSHPEPRSGWGQQGFLHWTR